MVDMQLVVTVDSRSPYVILRNPGLVSRGQGKVKAEGREPQGTKDFFCLRKSSFNMTRGGGGGGKKK